MVEVFVISLGFYFKTCEAKIFLNIVANDTKTLKRDTSLFPMMSQFGFVISSSI